MYIYTNLLVRLFKNLYICIHIHIYVYMHKCSCMCEDACAHTCTYVYVYVYGVYIYIQYVHIHIYIYTCGSVIGFTCSSSFNGTCKVYRIPCSCCCLELFHTDVWRPSQFVHAVKCFQVCVKGFARPWEVLRISFGDMLGCDCVWHVRDQCWYL